MVLAWPKNSAGIAVERAERSDWLGPKCQQGADRRRGNGGLRGLDATGQDRLRHPGWRLGKSGEGCRGLPEPVGKTRNTGASGLRRKRVAETAAFCAEGKSSAAAALATCHHN